MQILELIIKNNLNLLKKKTASVHWTSHNLMQLLIGSNGFGKSTLLDEYSPLPANSKNYTKKGYKKVLLNHDNKKFIVITDFSNKHKHEFYIDDSENLNPGGTIGVQLALIKEHLGYTPEIHRILKGEVKFTTMSVQERKNFFSNISDVSVDYAIELYDSLKTELRNLLGVKKYNRKKIIEETSKLLDNATRLNLEKEMETLRTTLGELNSMRFNNVKAPNFDTATCITTLDMLTDEILKLRVEYTEVEDTRDIDRQVDSIKSNTLLISKDIESKLYEVEQVKRISSIIEEIEHYPNEAVEEDLNKHAVADVDLNNQIAISGFRVDSNNLNYVENMIAYHEANFSLLMDLLNQLPVDETKNFEKQSYLDELYAKENKCINSINALNSFIDTRLERIKFLSSLDEIECPKCENHFVPGFDKQEMDTLLLNNRKDGETIDKYRSLEKQVVEQITSVLQYQKLRKQIENILYSNYYSSVTTVSDNIKLATFILTDDLLYFNPTSLLKKLSTLTDALHLQKEKIINDDKIRELTTILDRRKMISGNVKCSNLTEIENDIELMRREIDKNKLEYKALIEFKSILTRFNDLKNQIHYYLEELDKSFVYTLQSDANYAIDAETTRLLTDVNELSKTIAKANISQGIVEHLNDTIKQVEEDELIINELIELLGPQKGLIGKSLISFTNYFVSQMNTVIGAIWTTPLTIAPMTVDDKGFSYKFKVYYYNEDNPSPDVTETSTGEQEIIDFAFTLITAACMGLNDYPLLLDETGRTFKPEHKVRLYDYLKLLVEYGRASGIVIISHFKGVYEALTRADVCRIDPTGLEIQEHENMYFELNRILKDAK